MAQTIKRNAKGVRRAAAARGTRRKVDRAKAKTGSLIDRLMRILPFTEAQLHTIFLTLILAVAAAIAWFVASLAGVPLMLQQQVALAAKDAGFEVVNVEVRGIKRLDQMKVYEKALGLQDRAMPLVDLSALRQDLLQLSWVKEARVARQLPNTLVIDIVERVPHAVLRKAGQLVLIDGTGHELEAISASDARGMLVLEGPGATDHVPALSRLLDAAPALRPQVAGAEWVGNRRWDIKFKSGQVLRLPQGNEEAAAAMIKFAQLDGRNRLLGGKMSSIDMRSTERITMCCTDHTLDGAVELAAGAEAGVSETAADGTPQDAGEGEE